MRKIYSKHFVVLLDKHDNVIWACGSRDWMKEYEPHKDLREDATFCSWEVPSYWRIK